MFLWLKSKDELGSFNDASFSMNSQNALRRTTIIIWWSVTGKTFIKHDLFTANIQITYLWSMDILKMFSEFLWKPPFGALKIRVFVTQLVPNNWIPMFDVVPIKERKKEVFTWVGLWVRGIVFKNHCWLLEWNRNFIKFTVVIHNWGDLRLSSLQNSTIIVNCNCIVHLSVTSSLVSWNGHPWITTHPVNLTFNSYELLAEPRCILTGLKQHSQLINQA